MDDTAGNPGPASATWPARVVVIEDDQRLREYAIAALAGAEEIAVIGEAATLAAGLELVELRPDLILLDLGLPDGSGIAVIEEVRAKVPLCRILVFTVFEDRVSVLGTLKAGADGYILKDTSAEMVLGHVRAVLAGETPISARAAGHLLTLVRDDAPTVSPEQAKDVPRIAGISGTRAGPQGSGAADGAFALYGRRIYAGHLSQAAGPLARRGSVRGGAGSAYQT